MEERFWPKVNKNTGIFVRDLSECWYWTASISTGGYGKFGIYDEESKKNSWIGAHRVSYLIHNGEIPDDLCVRHACDNRRCVNPDHLSLGTKKDNTRDMMERGRNKYTIHTKTGEKNPMSKLSDYYRNQIYDRLQRGESRRLLAEEYGVSRQTIDNIANK